VRLGQQPEGTVRGVAAQFRHVEHKLGDLERAAQVRADELIGPFLERSGHTIIQERDVIAEELLLRGCVWQGEQLLNQIVFSHRSMSYRGCLGVTRHQLVSVDLHRGAAEDDLMAARSDSRKGKGISTACAPPPTRQPTTSGADPGLAIGCPSFMPPLFTGFGYDEGYIGV
jgi:hypothetical protein